MAGRERFVVQLLPGGKDRRGHAWLAKTFNAWPL
jgi:hypothetical protein